MSKSTDSKRDVYAIVTDRLLAKLDEGVAPWRKPWTTSRPANLFSKKAYRGINVIMLASAGFASPYWVTYKQAQQHGGNVRKGEHGELVVFWTRKVKVVKDDAGEERDEVRFILRYYTVFNVEQTEGLDKYLPETTTTEAVDPIAEAEAILAGFDGPTIQLGSDSAYYSPMLDLVNVPAMGAFVGADEFYSTMFHELTHSTGHESRLARAGVTDPSRFGSHTYAEEELVAEFGAAFLCGHAGISRTLDNSASYIANWKAALTENPRWAVTAAAQAQKAADAILGITFDES
jgi:antirestriction protein ArdC